MNRHKEPVRCSHSYDQRAAFLVAATIFVALRLVSRIFVARKVTLSDHMMFASWALVCALSVAISMQMRTDWACDKESGYIASATSSDRICFHGALCRPTERSERDISSQLVES